MVYDLNAQIKDKNMQLVNEQNEFNEKSALKDQEINFINDQINENYQELNDFKKTFNEKIEMCKNQLIEEFKSKYDEIKAEKERKYWKY